MGTDGGIFISYRRIDTNWAAIAMRQHFHRELPGARLFMDITDIEPGVDFRDAIRDRVDRSKVVLAVTGPNWLTVQDSPGRRPPHHHPARAVPQVAPRPPGPADAARGGEYRHASRARVDRGKGALAGIGPRWRTGPRSPGRRRRANEHEWVRIEIALGLERAALGKARVIPVLIDGTRMPDEASLPDLLKPLSFLNAVSISFASYARDLDDLTDAIACLIPKAKRGPSPVSPPPPAATTGAEADIATAIADSMEEVGTDPRTMMIYAYGQSEAGKNVISQTVTERALSKLLSERKPDDPDVLAARHNIAAALLDQGKAAEAEAAFRDLLPLRERVQGPEHPGTLSTRHSIAVTLIDQGNAAEAEAAFRALLPLTARGQGPRRGRRRDRPPRRTRSTAGSGSPPPRAPAPRSARPPPAAPRSAGAGPRQWPGPANPRPRTPATAPGCAPGPPG